MSSWSWIPVDQTVGYEKFRSLWNTKAQSLQQAVNEKQRESLLDIRDFGADSKGQTDSTTAMQKAAATGRSMIAPVGTYKITGDVRLATVGQKLILQGATINSTAGRLLCAASQTMIDGGGHSTFNFLNGAPASSLDRAVRATGSYNGSGLPISTAIAAGDMSFEATNASDVSAAVAGDWFIVGEFSTDWQRVEWKQVASVSGTTVNVTEPFRRGLADYTLQFYKVTPLEDVTVKGLKIVTSGLVNDNIGVDAQLCRNFKLQGCRFDVAKGLAFAHYMHDRNVCTDNIVDRQVGRSSTASTCVDGYFANNTIRARGGIATGFGLKVETGTAWTTFQSNKIVGQGGAGVINAQWVDFNKFIDNEVTSDGASIGLYILGGEGNTCIGNQYHNVIEGERFAAETGSTPDRLSTGNTSIGAKVRTATRGINVGGTGNSVLMLDVDSSVTTPVLDGGTNTTIMYKDPATGKMIVTPSSLPQQIALAGAAGSITQLLLGTSSTIGSVGTRWSGGDMYIADNATHTLGSDLWHQSLGTIASKLWILRTNGNAEFYSAAIGKADGTFATFWGTAAVALVVGGRINLNGTQVISTRDTGWTAMTGSPDKATAYATSTVTLAQLAGRVAQLQATLTAHGLIGA